MGPPIQDMIPAQIGYGLLAIGYWPTAHSLLAHSLLAHSP
jgi:hypothetical protein